MKSNSWMYLSNASDGTIMENFVKKLWLAMICSVLTATNEDTPDLIHDPSAHIFSFKKPKFRLRRKYIYPPARII